MGWIRRRGGNVVVSLDENETALLRVLIADLQALLDDDGGDYADPLDKLTGLSDTDRELPTDPALARLLPDGYRDDPEAAKELRGLTEGSLRDTKDQAAQQVLDALPERGGRVRLTTEEAGEWLTTFNDLRLILGTRLEITEESDPLGGFDRRDPRAASYLTYQWLTFMQDRLVAMVLR